MRTWTTVLLATLVAAGCTAGAADPPARFQRISGNGFTLFYPQDWRVRDEQPDRILVEGTPGMGDIIPGAEAVRDTSFRGDFDVAVDGFNDQANLLRYKDREVVSDRALRIAGAEQARLVESTWTSEHGIPMRQLDLFALAPGGEAVYYLGVNSAAADFDEPLFRAIVESFRLHV